jgi:hypothetical protein
VSKESQNWRKVESCSTGTMFFHSACVVMLGVGGGEGIEEVGAIDGVRFDTCLRVGRVCLWRRALGFCCGVWLVSREDRLVWVRGKIDVGVFDGLCDGENGIA